MKAPDTVMTKSVSLALLLCGTALLGGTAILGTIAFGQDTQSSANAPRFTTNGRMEFPAQYREWVYLSTGFNMSYSPQARMGHDMFDNVFVNPQSYRAFLETGTWPDKTVMVLELRGTGSDRALNKAGSYQGAEVMGVEVHVKDSARFDGEWAFFGFSGTEPATMVPKSANCYSCHEEHAAVDRTFVQFYPTLLPIATKKGTLARSYLEKAGK
jgi:Cytochrome P460